MVFLSLHGKKIKNIIIPKLLCMLFLSTSKNIHCSSIVSIVIHSIKKYSSPFISIFSISGITSFFDSQGNIKDYFKIKKSIRNILLDMDFEESFPLSNQPGLPAFLHVHLDGCIIGCINSSKVDKVVSHLRKLKVLSPGVVCLCQTFYSLIIYYFVDIDFKIM